MPTASSTKLKERASRKGWSELGATLIFAASIFAVTCQFAESRPWRFDFCPNSIATRR